MGTAAALAGGCSWLGGCKSPRRSSGSGLSVNIVNTASNNTYTLQQLLNQLGYLKEFGVEATTLNVSDGSKLMGALLSGGSDICLLAGFGQVLPAIEKGGKLRLVAAASLLPIQSIYTGRTEIQQIKDLEGKTIGVGSPGALLHQLVVATLRKKGVDPHKVTFVNVGSSADVFRAVAAKTVDAGPALEDVSEQAKKYGVHSLKDGNLWEVIPEFTYQGSFASLAAIEKKRDAIVRTLAAYCKLYRFIQGPDSKDAFVKARSIALNNSSREESLAEWQFIQDHRPYAFDLALSEERVRYLQNLNLEFGIQKTLLPYDKVADPTLARDAVRLLEHGPGHAETGKR